MSKDLTPSDTRWYSKDHPFLSFLDHARSRRVGSGETWALGFAHDHGQAAPHVHLGWCPRQDPAHLIALLNHESLHLAFSAIDNARADRSLDRNLVLDVSLNGQSDPDAPPQ